MLNKLVNTQIDGIIVQDLGLFYILNQYFPSLSIHASTQLTTHNQGQIQFLKKLKATRVNLSRELNINEIKSLTSIAHKHNILTEVFVHGSNCVSFSGLCYMSSVNGGNSGNRGRCSQPCRDQYLATAEGKNFPLNIKDNSAFSDLRLLAEAKVDSLKIEGRIKKYHYVYTVVDTWKKHLVNFYQSNNLNTDSSALHQVFNRDLTNSFLQNKVGKDTFIDNPRDNSAPYLTTQIKKYPSNKSDSSTDKLTQAKKQLYDIKTKTIIDVKSKIDQLSIDKLPLSISFSGNEQQLLKVSIKTAEKLFSLQSESKLAIASGLQNKTNQHIAIKKNKSKFLSKELLFTRFKAINETPYYIENFAIENLADNLIIPFKELTHIKKEILFRLNENIAHIDPIEKISIFNAISTKKKNNTREINHNKAKLLVLISSTEDLYLCNNNNADIYFEIPNSLSHKLSTLVDLFLTQQQLGQTIIPWFPSILIGENYQAAIKFLQQVNPKKIITNNTGIAEQAFQQGINWIAGPYLNIVNSFSVQCLKENFNCSGAFISNEINKNQIKHIKKPDNFELYYSIYHPIVLMTSKACFFHQVTGCKKTIVDGACINRCEKSSLITNLKGVSYLIKKSKANYHTIYNETNFLNTEIITDLTNKFSNFLIDLREIKTQTKLAIDKQQIIHLFEKSLDEDSTAIAQIKDNIIMTTNSQYHKGI